MRTIAIVNLKGGVGKTITAVNLAAILATEYHQRVLLVDADPRPTPPSPCCRRENTILWTACFWGMKSNMKICATRAVSAG